MATNMVYKILMTSLIIVGMVVEAKKHFAAEAKRITHHD